MGGGDIFVESVAERGFVNTASGKIGAYFVMDPAYASTRG
jgi:hypothetical protein